MSASTQPWYLLGNSEEVPSPALLVYEERVERNVSRMIEIAGTVDRLRPHVKTHKLGEVIQMQLKRGITKFKCATIAETEMVATCGAADALLAYQPVGPNVKRMLGLVQAFPKTKFSAIVDDAQAIRALAEAFQAARLSLDVLLDIDCGMHRTGVAPGPAALELYKQLASSPGLRAAGLHVYDGHIGNTDLKEREAVCEAGFAPVQRFRQELLDARLPVPAVVCGGTPTFPIHARRPDVQCSPGTCLLWDFGYLDKLPDLDFLPAALVLTRVVSKPALNLLCLDLGHKAIAAENPHPRARFFGLEDAKATVHSEEHLVIETAHAAKFAVGDCVYGIPRHICPTVALHSEAVVVRNGKAGGRWKIVARNRTLTV